MSKILKTSFQRLSVRVITATVHIEGMSHDTYGSLWRMNKRHSQNTHNQTMHFFEIEMVTLLEVTVMCRNGASKLSLSFCTACFHLP